MIFPPHVGFLKVASSSGALCNILLRTIHGTPVSQDALSRHRSLKNILILSLDTSVSFQRERFSLVALHMFSFFF